MDENKTMVGDPEQVAERYRSLVEHSPDAICVHEGGVVVYLNPAGVRLLAARSADEIVGRPVSDFVAPDSVASTLARIEGSPSTGDASKRAVLTLLRADGARIPVQTVSVLTIWQGRRAYQVVLHDLSAQHAAEQAQRRAEQHFTAIVSQLEEGVVVISRQGMIESINPAAVRIFGCRGVQLVGARFDALPLRMVDSDGVPLPPTRHPVARTMATGEPVTRFVFGVDGTDHHRRWLAGNCRLLEPTDRRSPVVSSFTDITATRASQRELQYQATHDGLTGLLNRPTILSDLETALAHPAGGPLSAVLFVDLDGFKAINDSHGHVAGDVVLQIVAQRLLRAVRRGDLVGRLGGDEFLVLLGGHELGPEAVIQRLAASVAEPIVAQGHRLAVRASIGVTLIVPGDPRTATEILHDADTAMYHQKAHPIQLDAVNQ
ncbi:PAS domain S-box-containing protein/diguanylate cyclase (GGDEF) domain-containing protein [Nocardia amikacinitolerans]|uniref:diguanylate cyclase domain-containing protein n=1 Tax=Nocardia amikacinitolerans TaxID=756689 RepID=UPI0008349488|nr:diguanylate cyclase [Nocardia amikacinitolerans]MCP2319969.1 PAS domain S-box-containing protein/diguanylate cyclase (GGDEF) domain-containing protein [Nocardia amikacinitolerans]